MKTILALLALSVSTLASAACYQIFAPSNELVWQGTYPPVPMNTVSLGNEVQKLVPNGHMVISESGAQPCPPIELTAPRKTMRDKAQKMKNDRSTPSRL